MLVTPPIDRLHHHLRTWLGQWPAAERVEVVGSVSRERPGWDGRTFPVIGVRSPESGVLSVPRHAAETVRAAIARSSQTETAGAWAELLGALPRLLGAPERRVYSGVFRWCERPAELADAGTWVDVTHPSVPEWLLPFGSPILVALDPQSGAYLAGVGIKRHDPYGQEIAVGTAPEAQGKGLARALVAQAARRILDEGAVPTYQHDPANIASARVAEASGFPDRGWRSAGMA